MSVGSFAGPSAGSEREEPLLAPAAAGTTPFLSVITRTQGRRPHTLVEVLTCLAAQTDTDFEVLIMGHRLDPMERSIVDGVVADSPVWLRNKIRHIAVEDGNRTRPLNVGFAAATGDYIAVLDDDDAVFAHWVETFHTLARATPGRVLRAVAVRQAVDSVAWQGLPGLRAADSPTMLYPTEFDFIGHILQNGSPLMSLAFSRHLLWELGLTFDESLTTTEDWDFLMRCASAVGVGGGTEITSIYRWWNESESSRTAHDKAEWQVNQRRILAKWDAEHFALPPGSVRQIVRLLEEHASFCAELRRLRHSGINVCMEASLIAPDRRLVPHGARAEVKQILESTSWRVSAPLRSLMHALGRGRPLDMVDLASLLPDEAEAMVMRLRQSTSWRITAPLRFIKRRQKGLDQ